MIRVGIIGYGYWGRNILRNFFAAKDIKVVSLCDTNPENLKKSQKLYPNLKLCQDYNEVITSPDIDAVAIITPVNTHYEISKSALKHGKHIFVEKPFTENSTQAQELIELAEKKKLMIMVDHTFIFTEAVKKIKELIDKDLVGNIHYYDATRVNLGLFRQDVNVIWDLAPHDFSIMDYLIHDHPVALSAHGMDHYNRGLCNTAYVTVYFKQLIAHFNFNWLSPVKIRSTYIGGEKKMIVWDDMESDEKVKVYDKGVVVINDDKEKIFQHKFNYRLGDVWVPQLEAKEALSSEADYFADCIMKQQKPITDGVSGLKIVKLLEATDYSIKNQGKLVNL